jgi:predicted metal-dependent phosphoesterase TrpH
VDRIVAGSDARLDLHCHSEASFDSTNAVEGIILAAQRRGLTHVAITDHDRVDGALRVRAAAPAGLDIIVGEEIRSLDGDLIALYVTDPVPSGLTAEATIAAVRAQGGLVGVPHPFDRHRPSVARHDTRALERIAGLLDFMEAWNGRVPYASANAQAAEFARSHGIPGVASSDAHTLLEIGAGCTLAPGPISGASDLRAALAVLGDGDLVTEATATGRLQAARVARLRRLLERVVGRT